MIPSLFNNLTEQDKCQAIEKLVSSSAPRTDFFLMIILAITMATFGLLLNSAAIIIGSMLIAPMLYSILSLSMGIIMSDFNLISRSFYTTLKSIAFAIGASILITIFFSSGDFVPNAEIMARTQPSLAYGAVAIIAGLAASFAMVKPHLNETLPGIAVSVALVPPLATTGIGIALLDWNIISNSLVLFLINVVGIIFASMLIFSLMNFYVKRSLANEAMQKEEILIEQEKEQEQE
ncbi:MAG: TIGR00341 family protein [Candidatus Moranbacteria bacterium CG10_big_fil_rev_8_21_14_0_10_35_21]|nr:MAG: TIGR00341 family protein [Candidatus Moranbacteria bacterium CG10_big_fil_rev_8_21_14_0_10_35_21]PJA88235.1 MAG: TIGR00341 family protein [Candidatus Moranbacteria bacterium CG_4_9_14_3_um_filter_36_9]